MDKLFSFGDFNSLTGEASNFSIWELSFFIILGCLGGLIGAVFNATKPALQRALSLRVIPYLPNFKKSSPLPNCNKRTHHLMEDAPYKSFEVSSIL